MSVVRIGLALGGGGARGLAHVHALEAFDELGIKPVSIAGTSIGSLFGAGYAAGLSGRDLHEHVAAMLRRRADVLVKITKARIGRMTDLFGAGSRNPVLLDAERLIAQFLQAAIVAGKVAQKGPDALIRPSVETITLLDFLKSGAVLQATAATKDETKRALDALLAR